MDSLSRNIFSDFPKKIAFSSPQTQTFTHSPQRYPSRTPLFPFVVSFLLKKKKKKKKKAKEELKQVAFLKPLCIFEREPENFMDIHPVELARQLVLMEFDIFRKITPLELLHQVIFLLLLLLLFIDFLMTYYFL